VPTGDARAAAEALAAELVRFPQLCMRNDRLSAYEQFDLGMDEALRNEMRRGLETLGSGETLQGATRFVSGRGRGGSFEDL